MKVKTDQSYGVVPVFQGESGYEFLLVHQISYVGNKFWNFPKGHAEAGESGEVAALRELEEETGLTELQLETKKTLSIYYEFKDKECLVKKTATYYIGYCENKNTTNGSPREIEELYWCSLEEAKELATHQNTKDLLDKVAKFLN